MFATPVTLVASPVECCYSMQWAPIGPSKTVLLGVHEERESEPVYGADAADQNDNVPDGDSDSSTEENA
jgi:hypothetical protein